MSEAATPGAGTGVNTADLYDERGDELASVALQFQSLGGRTHFSGPKCGLSGVSRTTPWSSPPWPPRATARCW